MRAMVLHQPGMPLALEQRTAPVPGPGEILVEVAACGVCRTDLHVCDGELTHPHLPLVPGHEIVGRVVARGPGATRYAAGDRIGIPWLGHTCGQCAYCLSGRENLCERPRFTGYQHDGGYAEYAVADERFCFPIPDKYSDVEAAPLLCAGLIGYRAYRMTGKARRIGLYGFGAAAHILAQVAQFEGREVLAFTRRDDPKARLLALDLGCAWAGSSDEMPPAPIDAAIIFAPVGGLVPQALRATGKGGVVVCAGIHMSDIPSFPYSLLWEERIVRSVANLTKRDGEEFLALAAKAPLRTTTSTYPLEQANQALDDLRGGAVTGAAVLVPSRPQCDSRTGTGEE